MSIKSQSLPFTQLLIQAAPDTTGVFALWQNGGVIYLGKASAGAATIRGALGDEFQARQWHRVAALQLGSRRRSGPAPRSASLGEFEVAHHCVPLSNDPQRLLRRAFRLARFGRVRRARIAPRAFLRITIASAMSPRRIDSDS